MKICNLNNNIKKATTRTLKKTLILTLRKTKTILKLLKTTTK